jgi:hypothetical protein
MLIVHEFPKASCEVSNLSAKDPVLGSPVESLGKRRMQDMELLNVDDLSVVLNLKLFFKTEEDGWLRLRILVVPLESHL